jgi:hypothetical protein
MHKLRFLGQEFGNNNNSYISRTRFYLCESKIFVIAFVALWLSLATFTVTCQWYHGLPTSGNWWCRLLSCNQNMPMHRQYIGVYICACAIACKITVSNTSGLYWEFRNIQYRRCGLNRQKDIIFCVWAAPQFWRENSCQKMCGLYMHKYGTLYPSCQRWNFHSCVDGIYKTLTTIQTSSSA